MAMKESNLNLGFLKFSFRFSAGFLAILLCLFLVLKIWSWISPPELNTAYSKEIYYSDGTLMHAYLSQDQKWRFQSGSQFIPERLKDWIMWKEDKYFQFHPGVNPVSVIRSFWQILEKGRPQTGASTISMQIIRLNRQLPRTWSSKWTELLEAIRLETSFTKETLFSYYLDHLPFGGNLEGFRAASLSYFGLEPNQLTLGQMAALVVVPNHPNRFHPIRQPDALLKKRNLFLDKLFKGGKISAEEYQMARLEPLFPSRHDFPREVPHLAEILKHQNENPIYSTVERKLQSDCQALLGQYSRRLKLMGIPNAALLIADYQTGKIKTYIGNPDFQDKESDGEIDGVRAIRSPGSTLKPFIYAMAMQKGMINPKSILFDIPQEFDGYAPENYDHQFRGAVSVDQALLQSLNLPAIQILKSIGVDSFVQFAYQLGIRSLMQKTKSPGLSVAVGGCSASLMELVQAYATLANQGTQIPLSAPLYEKSVAKPSPLKPYSCEMVRSMLAVGKRGEAILPFVRDRSGFQRFAWKTGTSFGRRDAWCIGFGNKMAVGLWLGDFKGLGNVALSGVDLATPIFQQIMLLAERPNSSQRLDSNLVSFGWKQRQVCTASGKKPGPFCTSQTMDWFIPLISSQEICDHIRKVDVSENEAFSYCQDCRPVSGYHSILVENRSPAIISFLRMKGDVLRGAPPHWTGCPRGSDSPELTIISPGNEKTYFLEGRTSIYLPVQFLTPDEQLPVTLFVNGKKVAISRKGEAFLPVFESGQHKISIKNQSGKVAEVHFMVKDF